VEPAGLRVRGRSAAPVPSASSVTAVRIAALAAILLAPEGGVGAEPPPPAPDTLPHVYLVTAGPGERVWEKFGHNMLWVHDPRTGRDVAYNWGIFDFAQEDFIARLLTGRMRYRMEPWDLESALRMYRAQSRSVRAQRLRLGPERTRELLDRIRINLRPENRHYDYDPFRDNCSTRIRDHLDHVLDGGIREAVRREGAGATGETYRSHTRRLLRRVAWAHAGIMLALGAPTDRSVTAWEEMFLPMRLEERLRTVRIPTPGPEAAGSSRPADPDLAGPDLVDPDRGDPDRGGLPETVPLVAEEDTLLAGGRPPAPAETPGFHPLPLVLGLAGGAAFLWLGLLVRRARRAGRDGRPAAFALGSVAALWSLVAGLAGAVMAGGWLFTEHWYVTRNENLFQAQPLSLLLALLVPLALATGRARRPASWLAAATAGLALLGLLAQALPGFGQVNGEIIALALPLHAGTAAGLAAAFDDPGNPHET